MINFALVFLRIFNFQKSSYNLPDSPQLQASELKSQFDAAPEEVRQYLNKLIDVLTSSTDGDSGANNIKTTSISGVSGNDVQTMLESFKTLLDDVSVGEFQNTTVNVNPSLVPTSNSGAILDFFSWFANRIKAITGKTNWYDAPDYTLKAESIPLTLVNGAQAVTGRTPQIEKVGKLVTVTGAVKNIAVGTVVSTLPVGSRPDKLLTITCGLNTNSPGNFCTWSIHSNGSVQLLNSTSGIVDLSLDEIIFVAKG